jgi:hypothetical protein
MCEVFLSKTMLFFQFDILRYIAGLASFFYLCYPYASERDIKWPQNLNFLLVNPSNANSASRHPPLILALPKPRHREHQGRIQESR